MTHRNARYCKNGSTEPGCETGFYGIDTQEQFFNITTEQSIAVDIISIHHYAPDSPTKPHCFFAKDPSDPNCIYNASLVGVVARLTEALGKMLFVGKYPTGIQLTREIPDGALRPISVPLESAAQAASAIYADVRLQS